MLSPEVATRKSAQAEVAGGTKILVADDDPVSRTLMIGILNSGQLGYEVLAANDGLQAWDALVANPGIELAILDLSMPGLGGMELIDRMHGDARFARIPVIICTANSDRATVVAAASRGITQFLVKPFARTAVLEKVWQVCRPATANNPPLINLSEARQQFAIDRETHRELLEQLIRMADAWASTTQRAADYPRVRSLGILAGNFRQLFGGLGAAALAQKFQETEDALAVYRRKPLQSEEAACYRQCRALGEKVQRELDRLREAVHTIA